MNKKAWIVVAALIAAGVAEADIPITPEESYEAAMSSGIMFTLVVCVKVWIGIFLGGLVVFLLRPFPRLKKFGSKIWQQALIRCGVFLGWFLLCCAGTWLTMEITIKMTR